MPEKNNNYNLDNKYRQLLLEVYYILNKFKKYEV